MPEAVNVTALAALLRAYVGPCSVSVTVELRDLYYAGHWADVGMAISFKIVEPGTAPKFAEGLRTLGVRWEAKPETVTAPGK